MAELSGRGRRGAKRVGVAVHDLPGFAFAPEYLSYPQLLQYPVAAAAQPGIRSFDRDRQQEVRGSESREDFLLPAAVAELQGRPVQASSHGGPALLIATEGAQDCDVVPARPQVLERGGISAYEVGLRRGKHRHDRVVMSRPVSRPL